MRCESFDCFLHYVPLLNNLFIHFKLQMHNSITLKFSTDEGHLIQNSQAVKKECGPQKGYGEKRCEIQGGGQEMAVMVG